MSNNIISKNHPNNLHKGGDYWNRFLGRRVTQLSLPCKGNITGTNINLYDIYIYTSILFIITKLLE